MFTVVRGFFKRHLLWVGFAAVLVPLGVLLVLQFQWLARLQRTSAIAEKTWLSNYVEAVSSEVEYFYRRQAERALNIPEELFGSHPGRLAYYLKKKEIEGARAVFVARYTVERGDWDGLVIFDPESGRLEAPDDPSLVRAIHVALSPWKILADKGAPLQSHSMTVDEKDPANRIILNPISDDGDRVIGVAGMVLDTAFFRDSLLPQAIEKSLPRFFDTRARENLIITVRDRTGLPVLGPEQEIDTGEVVGPLSFVFSDWTLGLGSRYATPEQWAKSNFMLNISLSVLLALALLGGLALALRTASREMRLSRMKADFVSNVSHELRTPLASIRVFGEFLRLGRVRGDDKSREYGEYIETESRRLTQLINNILDFSKIESGVKTYEFSLAAIEDVITGVMRTLQVSLKHHGFRLRYEGPAEPLPLVPMDGDAIRQALANLVDNAVKYSGPSTEILVRLQGGPEGIALIVRDHGIGISRSEQRKIFERFHRVSTGLIHDVKGSGLGLSIVHHIVKAHGGQITVDSEPGRGSTFTIHIPAPPPTDEPTLAPVPVGGLAKLEKT